MSHMRFTKDHEWVRVEGSVATFGITDHAQDQLGDIVFVELPSVGTVLAQGDEAAVVESVKAASEVYAPVSGEVTEINGELEGNPGLVNKEAQGGGWFAKIALTAPEEFEGLMSEAEYQAFLAESV
ncbi:MAG TPA: glycine cleavage system protein GcvH [Aestuariivirgaceae bacterium]|jgi:glycine cleavage system H protein|nr:glycine cleavage system protein GcvH [Aestuariivirgaceae bacterium]